jgi:DMSO/TMAO reductase YedYZ molybdopterin-dependent catalytic subunit
VGDRFIDATPAWLKNAAIDIFGTADKIALLVGIGVLLAAYAAILGLFALRGRRWMAIVGAIIFGLVGAFAALGGRADPSPFVVVPSVIGAMAAIAALLALGRLAEQPLSDPSQFHTDELDAQSIRASRRRVIVGAAGFATAGWIAAGIGRTAASRFSAGASRLTVATRNVFSGTPSVAPTEVLADAEGIKPFFTPNADFYRIDTALTVPQVPVESWNLTISGLVDTPITINYDELLDRELVEVPITLTCVSNEIGGGLMGTAMWGGIRLDDLLDEAGIRPSATQIVGRSVDGYTCGFPVAALDGRDALVAVAMNGEPLPLEHGFPARLIVPGLYGYVSATKWLTEIELTTFEDFDQYWVPRGWDANGPIKVQSRIDTPRALETIDAGQVAIGGTAWAQTRGIDRVEVRIDDGAWQDAALADELNDVTWRQWHLAWDATPGRHTITVRATDREGTTQVEERTTPMPNGATGWHQTVVLVS